VSFDRFQEVIEKLWQRVKNGHNENKKFNDRIGKLEKIIQEYFYHESRAIPTIVGDNGIR